ncbi:MAG: hypothetical protein HY321_14095 [Armatimonadetes bacterium]|nr:hypothetical protein [Armatimonadota bacterium]
MVADSQRSEDRLFAVCSMMRGLVESSIRDGMLRAIPDPVDARQLADVYARLLHRVRAVEMALQEFNTDLRRAQDLFERAERRVHGPRLLIEEEAKAAVG